LQPTTSLAAPVLLDALGRWGPIVWLKANPYAYPTLEIVHLIGIALVFGTLWVVDLAIFGKLRFVDVNLLARHVLPWTLAGFLFAAASGATMFLAGAGDLIANPAFAAKMGLLCVAGTNAAALHARGPIDPGNRLTRWQAVASVVLWVAVIASGRWIGYL
jgi:hypothetical protein